MEEWICGERDVGDEEGKHVLDGYTNTNIYEYDHGNLPGFPGFYLLHILSLMLIHRISFLFLMPRIRIEVSWPVAGGLGDHRTDQEGDRRRLRPTYIAHKRRLKQGNPDPPPRV